MLVDESLGAEVATYLREKGFNVVFVGDVGLIGRSDEEWLLMPGVRGAWSGRTTEISLTTRASLSIETPASSFSQVVTAMNKLWGQRWVWR